MNTLCTYPLNYIENELASELCKRLGCRFSAVGVDCTEDGSGLPAYGLWFADEIVGAGNSLEAALKDALA